MTENIPQELHRRINRICTHYLNVPNVPREHIAKELFTYTGLDFITCRKLAAMTKLHQLWLEMEIPRGQPGYLSNKRAIQAMEALGYQGRFNSKTKRDEIYDLCKLDYGALKKRATDEILLQRIGSKNERQLTPC